MVRSYLGYCAGSHQTSEAKRLWARIVLEWVTFREVLVTNPPLLHFWVLAYLFLHRFQGTLFSLMKRIRSSVSNSADVDIMHYKFETVC